MLKTSLKILAASLLVAPVSALAVPITVDFTITGTSAWDPTFGHDATSHNGYALGTMGTGSFTIDTDWGNYNNVAVGLTPLDFSINWLGVGFTEPTAQLWELGVNPSGGLDYWGFGILGGTCESLNCVSSTGVADFYASGYSPAYGSVEDTGVAAIHQTNVDGFMLGSIAWSVRSVPEPTTLGLFAFSLLGAAVARRKRAAN